jgi:hypothetical protein
MAASLDHGTKSQLYQEEWEAGVAAGTEAGMGLPRLQCGDRLVSENMRMRPIPGRLGGPDTVMRIYDLYASYLEFNPKIVNIECYRL